MNPPNRPFFGLVLFIALCLGLEHVSFAAPFTLSSVDATWDNLQPADPIPPFNIPGNPAFFNTSKESSNGVLIRSIARWGEPATSSGQSGLDYVPPPLGPIPTNAEHPFGTLKHINNPVFDPGVSSVKLDLLLAINDGSTTHMLNLDLLFAIEETLNNAGDTITLEGITIAINDGEGSTLNITGFKEELGDLTPPAPFVTSEEVSGKQVILVSSIVTLPGEPPGCSDCAAVPEPSTILLLGSGLAGLAAWRRFRGKHRTN